MIDKIKEYINEANNFSTQNASELEAFRIKFLGILLFLQPYQFIQLSQFRFVKYLENLNRFNRTKKKISLWTSFFIFRIQCNYIETLQIFSSPQPLSKGDGLLSIFNNKESLTKRH